MPTPKTDNTQRTRFASRLAALPQRPGVYIMRNEKGDVIYVGKAASLRNRVRNYFGAPHCAWSRRRRPWCEQIADFEYIVTQNAAEALHLEATLVKRHQPFFNVRLKDDKHYPYLRIDVQNAWPRVEIARRVAQRRRALLRALRFGVVGADHAGHRQEALPVALLHQGDHGHGPATLPRLLHPPLHRALYGLLHQGGVRRGHPPDHPLPRRQDERGREVAQDADGGRIGDAGSSSARRCSATRSRPSRTWLRSSSWSASGPTDEDVFGLARDASTEKRAASEACVQVFFIRGTQMVGRDFFTLDGVQDETGRRHPGQLPQAVLRVGRLRTEDGRRARSPCRRRR